MSRFHPFAELRAEDLHLGILDAGPVRSFDIKCVVELTDFGEVVGVEIIDLARHLDGGAIAPARRKGDISWSYDAEIDALYFRLAEGSGQVQRSVVGGAQTDSAGRVVTIEVPIPQAA